MIINTRRFGEIKIDRSKIITFHEGVIGFGKWQRYVLMPFAEGTPFELMQSADEPNLAFVLIDPFLFRPDYHVDLSEQDLESIDVKEIKEVVVRVIVTLTSDVKNMTANLQGPVLINESKFLGKQIVIVGQEYSLRHPIIPS